MQCVYECAAIYQWYAMHEVPCCFKCKSQFSNQENVLRFFKMQFDSCISFFNPVHIIMNEGRSRMNTNTMHFFLWTCIITLPSSSSSLFTLFLLLAQSFFQNMFKWVLFHKTAETTYGLLNFRMFCSRQRSMICINNTVMTDAAVLFSASN